MNKFNFYGTFISTNIHLQTIEKIVLEPEHEKFTKIHVENEPVFNMWKGFRLVDYEKEYSDKKKLKKYFISLIILIMNKYLI